MGDHQHCGAVVRHFLQQPHDDGSAFGIQISGGFVRYQKFRTIHQSSRYADASHFAAGKLFRVAFRQIVDLQSAQQCVRTLHGMVLNGIVVCFRYRSRRDDVRKSVVNRLFGRCVGYGFFH